jgi:hypothetical protein
MLFTDLAEADAFLARAYLAIKQAEYRPFMGEVGEQDWRWYLGRT